MSKLTLIYLDGRFSVCQLPSQAEIPQWAYEGPIFSVMRTYNELSIVCETTFVPSGIKAESGWIAIQVAGCLDFSLTGILASIAKPLGEAKISLFALSTYDTDYILIKETKKLESINVLKTAGFIIKGDGLA